MPKYPKRSLAEKLEWMRARSRQKEEEARQKEEEELMARLAKLNLEKARWIKEQARLEKQEKPASDEGERRRMLRVDEVADILSVSVSTVQRWFRHRAVVVHPGPRKTTMLISQRTLDDWIDEHQAKPPVPVRR